MADTEQPARKKVGRPSKSPDGQPRITHSLRLRGQTREQLIEAAKESGRSISEEIEHRVERSFLTERLQEIWGGLTRVEQEMTQVTAKLIDKQDELLDNQNALLDKQKARIEKLEQAQMINRSDLRAIIEETVEHTMRRFMEMGAADVEATFSDKPGPYDDPPHRSSRRRKPADAKPALTTEDDPKS